MSSLDRLRSVFGGTLFGPGEPGYEEARRVWNGDVDRSPAVIARCTGPADVVAAVRFAGDRDLPVAVRGGGHAVAGHAMCDGGLVVDLSSMTEVRVDPGAGIVTTQGGAVWGDVDRRTQVHGLAVTGGVVTHTGVGGLTLGGGIGHLMRRFGLAIDNLIGCDVVTADGRVVAASRDEHPDLFWGLRGGGGNFGVVTSFRFELHPLGPIVQAGVLAYPMEEAPDVLRRFRDFVVQAPDEVGIMANLRLAPPLPFVPEHLHGRPIVAIAVCHAGSVDEGERAFGPLREFGTPSLDVVAPTPYVSHQAMFDAAFPHGRRYYWRSHELPAMSDEAIDVIVDHCSRITSPLSSVPIFTLGGAVARVGEDDTAYANRAAQHDINIVAAWESGDGERERHVDWVHEFWSAMRPFASGVYVNFMSDESRDSVRVAYGDRKHARLVELKRTYDPSNRFRFNQNISPFPG